MTSLQLTDRIIALIDELIPHTATEDVSAAVSVLLAAASAVRGDQILPLSVEIWKCLDHLTANEGTGLGRPQPGTPLASDPPPAADREAERFLRVWSRAVAVDDPNSRRFTDLWFRLLLLRAENDELGVRISEILDRSRRLRTRVR